jgi:hypothetical protein
MLVDPQGNRLISGPSPNPSDKGKIVNFLVEVAQPLGGAEAGYTLDGVSVADFARPEFYDATKNKVAKYDFTGAAKKPFKILKGGYMSWVVPDTSEWFQETWFDGDAPTIRSLGKIN